MTKFILVLILLLTILPPLVYQYQYPSCGDDSLFHLQRVDQIEQDGIFIPDSRYIGQNFTWVLLSPFENKDYAFVWFNWIILGGAMFSIYWFGNKLAGKQAGLAMLFCAVFISQAFLNFFHNGTIYNMVALYIIGLSGAFCLLRWLEGWRPYLAITSLLLWALLGIYHSSTGVVTATSICLFLVGYILVMLKKKDHQKAKRVAVYFCCFLVAGIIVPYFLNPELHRLINQIIGGELNGKLAMNTPELSPNGQLSAMYWIFKVWSPWIAILATVSVLIIRKYKAKINVKLVCLLLSYCTVLAIGAFTALFYDTHRFGMDLAVMASLLGGYLITVAIKARNTKKYTIAVWGALVLSAIPAFIWLLSFNNSMTPADLKAIEYMNTLNGSTFTTSSQIQPMIYTRFTDKEYTYPEGDYIIYRSDVQSEQSNPNSWWYPNNDHYPNVSNLSDYNGLEELGNWSFGKVTVILFKGE